MRYNMAIITGGYMPVTHMRTKAIGFVLIFILPMILAASVYLGRDYFDLTPKTQGTLITPPLSLAELKLKTLDGTVVTPDDFGKSWWLIYVAPAECDEECAVQVAKIRSVHMALTKSASRVKRLMLLQPHSLPPSEVKAAAEDKLLTVDYIQNPDYLLQGCPADANLAEGLFIMDPRGNMMMCYKPKQEAHAILKDLEKLLKASQIG